VRTTKRQSEPSVIQQLIDEPHRFGFHQTIRLVLALLRNHDISEDRARSQVLRFENCTRLVFPASEIENLHGAGVDDVRTDRMLVLALENKSKLQIRITPAFIGFLGTCGVLPFHYSERIAAHQKKERSDGARAFMDVFSNRFIDQFHLAWTKYRLEHSITTRSNDRQRSILLSLAGKSMAQSPYDDLLAYYSTLFRTRPASAYAITRALTEYFGIPIKVEQSVGSWDEVPLKMRSRLGRQNQRLGFSAALGRRLWRHDRRVRLNIGPLNGTAIAQFVPQSAGEVALKKMLTLFDIGPIEIEIRLLLKPDCARPLTLATRNSSHQSTLGRTTFLTSGAKSVVRPEVLYMLNLDRVDSNPSL
jgi:type VI secretion system protein ImpH